MSLKNKSDISSFPTTCFQTTSGVPCGFAITLISVPFCFLFWFSLGADQHWPHHPVWSHPCLLHPGCVSQCASSSTSTPACTPGLHFPTWQAFVLAALSWNWTSFSGRCGTLSPPASLWPHRLVWVARAGGGPQPHRDLGRGAWVTSVMALLFRSRCPAVTPGNSNTSSCTGRGKLIRTLWLFDIQLLHSKRQSGLRQQELKGKVLEEHRSEAEWNWPQVIETWKQRESVGSRVFSHCCSSWRRPLCLVIMGSDQF